jgi:hypothetical protein
MRHRDDSLKRVGTGSAPFSAPLDSPLVTCSRLITLVLLGMNRPLGERGDRRPSAPRRDRMPIFAESLRCPNEPCGISSVYTGP